MIPSYLSGIYSECFGKLTWLMAWVLRFVGQSKKVLNASTSYLGVHEIRSAVSIIVAKFKERNTIRNIQY